MRSYLIITAISLMTVSTGVGLSKRAGNTGSSLLPKVTVAMAGTDTGIAVASLSYPIPDSIRPQSFYTEAWVIDDAPGIFAPISFGRGYVAFERTAKGEQQLVVAITDHQQGSPQLIASGIGVNNAQTSQLAYSTWKQNWKGFTPHKLAITLLPDSAKSSSIYAAYYYQENLQRWKLLAAYRLPGYERKFNQLGAFLSAVNTIDLANGKTKAKKADAQRQIFLSHTWVQQGSRWRELPEAIEVNNGTNNKIKNGIIVEDSTFQLWAGGKSTVPGIRPYIRRSLKQSPVIDYTKDADSVARAGKDLMTIVNAVKEGKLDTTGSINGVYYHILQEGTGAYVKVTDSVTVHYKGSLLQDGSVFDQTKDKPATFLLGRLIKGWQLALPQSKVGGKIRVVIPSGQAYGIRTRSTAIPPNSILVFDIEVLKSW
jgi:FKBP-type peptidyl-prolyl cis-trans isomerase